MIPAIEFKNITKTFVRKDGRVQTVLDKVNFSIPAEKTTVIAGGSGQGKSVTLKLILGLMRADSGQILVQGKDVTGARGKELEFLRTQFGVLFQGSALFDSLTVFENVALPLRERTEKKEEELETALQKLGHQTRELDSDYGNMQVIVLNKKSGEMQAASDGRGIGSAEVLH